MNQKVRDFKWWVPISNASEFERVMFMCKVFGLVAYEDLERCPEYGRGYTDGYEGFGSVAFELNQDYDVIACDDCHMTATAIVFENLESLYAKLQELADDQVDS